MSYRAKIDGTIVMGGDFSSEIKKIKDILEENGQEFDLTSFILNKAKKTLKIDKDLWVSECFQFSDVDFERRTLTIHSSDAVQYYGIEVILLFLAAQGCCGSLRRVGECGELQIFIVEKGSVKVKSFSFLDFNEISSSDHFDENSLDSYVKLEKKILSLDEILKEF